MKRKVVALLLTITLCSTPAQIFAQEEPEAVNDNAISEIGSFRGYDWGASFEDVSNAEIADDMQEEIDYEVGTFDFLPDGEYCLYLLNSNVGGYDADVYYFFSDSCLSYAGYSLEMDDNKYSDLLNKYSSKYGEPVTSVQDEEGKSYVIWVDSSRNYICMSEATETIIYSIADSFYAEMINETWQYYYSSDFTDIISAAGNMDGI